MLSLFLLTLVLNLTQLKIMPNLNEHLKIGATTGAIAGGILNGIKQFNQMQSDPTKAFDFKELIGSAIAGSMISTLTCMLPDILEPATNPNHRQFFHSITAYGTVIYLSHRVGKSQFSIEEQNFLQCVLSGYASHLLADSQTPKGLNII